MPILPPMRVRRPVTRPRGRAAFWHRFFRRRCGHLADLTGRSGRSPVAKLLHSMDAGSCDSRVATPKGGNAMKRIWLVMFTGALLLGGVAVSPAQPGNPADPMERAIGHLE